jgi:hypothetical protein
MDSLLKRSVARRIGPVQRSASDADRTAPRSNGRVMRGGIHPRRKTRDNHEALVHERQPHVSRRFERRGRCLARTPDRDTALLDQPEVTRDMQ